MSASMLDAAVDLRRRLDPMLLAGASLILLQTVVRAVIVFPSYYWQDDFGHLDLARRLGLSQEFLVRDYNSHLEIGPNLVYWLFGSSGSLSFAPAALSLVVMQLLASCLLLAVLRQLFGRSPWLLLPFAGYLFTPLGLPVATWWAAGLEAMPLQIAMLLSLLGVIRAVREHSWRWAAVSVGGHVLGLLFWEKAALILPTLVAALLLVEWAGEPFGRRLLLLGRQWRYLVPHGIVLALYIPFYLSVVDFSDVLTRDRPSLLSTSSEALFRLLIPGIFGGPWTTSGAENTVFPYPPNAVAVFFVVLFLAIVAGSVLLRGGRAFNGWAFLGGYVAVDLILLNRAELIGLAVRDPRYITDSLPIIAIGFCAAFTGPLVQRRLPASVGRPGTVPGSPMAVTAFLMASSLLTSFLLAGGLQHRDTRNFAFGVVKAMDSNPGVSVINGPVPANLNGFTDLDRMLQALGEERTFDQPGIDVRMFDGLADLRPIMVVDPRLQKSGPDPDCGWTVEGEWQRLGALPDPGRGSQVLRLGYVTGQEATLQLAVGGREQSFPVSPGLGHVTFVVTGQQGEIAVRVADVVSGGLCVVDVEVGAPWPADGS
jgi:hypothetical protein